MLQHGHHAVSHKRPADFDYRTLAANVIHRRPTAEPAPIRKLIMDKIQRASAGLMRSACCVSPGAG